MNTMQHLARGIQIFLSLALFLGALYFGVSVVYAQVCGNTVRESGEGCDALDLGGQTCANLGVGFTGGILFCNGDCTLNTFACTPQPPYPPSGLAAVAVSTSQIDLSWTDGSHDENGFRIERKRGQAGTYSQIVTLVPNATVYRDAGLTPNTTYVYRMRAYNSAGTSEYSNEALVTTLGGDTTPPAPPRGLAVE